MLEDHLEGAEQASSAEEQDKSQEICPPNLGGGCPGLRMEWGGHILLPLLDRTTVLHGGGAQTDHQVRFAGSDGGAKCSSSLIPSSSSSSSPSVLNCLRGSNLGPTGLVGGVAGVPGLIGKAVDGGPGSRVQGGVIPLAFITALLMKVIFASTSDSFIIRLTRTRVDNVQGGRTEGRYPRGGC